MAQPRLAASHVPLGQILNNSGWLLQRKLVEPLPGDSVSLPAKKRRRERSEPPKKRHRTEQKGLCELNFDELYIIFAYIYPMDLLNLARTCKSLRGILMHKSSVFLWRAALRRVEDLPPCPPDLTEPEYTNLVFYARCHGCGRAAQTILWNMRRRYCPACRAERLRRLCHCDIICRDGVVPVDWAIVADESAKWVDRDQLASFIREYVLTPDKTEFLNEKRKQLGAISEHARECEIWQQSKGRVHRFDLEILRKERQTSILEHLEQRGYGPEIAYFREEGLEKRYPSVFKKHNPLTEAEWARMWPEWDTIMNNLRLHRLEESVYKPRRRSLVIEYDKHVRRPSPDSPSLGFLPHVVDLARFPLFRDIIRAPEDIQSNKELFASTFAQLPMLVDEWMQNLSSEIAELMKIPSWLSPNTVSGSWHASPRRAASLLCKLRLACAVFHVGGGACFYPEILSVLRGNDDAHLNTAGILHGSIPFEIAPECAGSIYDRFRLQFLDEAPYIVHACGLDPNVATVEDMDRRNARLVCLCCGGPVLVMEWRQAILHARFYHCISIGLAPLCEAPRWRLVGDEHIDAIQAVERSAKRDFSPDWARCLLCRPHVGDAMMYDEAVSHLSALHGLKLITMKEGVHYKVVGIRNVCVVEMVPIEGGMAFKALEE